MGKTTTAVNLSASLASAGARTLLVDMDPQGNASSGVGVDSRSLDKTLYDVIVGNVDPGQILENTDVKGLDLLPSNQGLSGLEVELVGQQGRSFYLKKAPDYMGCYDTKPSTKKVDWPVTTADLKKIKGHKIPRIYHKK